MKNEYGMPLDRNGYAPSILWDDGCRYCGAPETVRHEVFYGGGRRETCKRLGLWVSACPAHHELVHNDHETDLDLKQWAQHLAMQYYGWSIEDFRQRFFKSYI